MTMRMRLSFKPALTAMAVATCLSVSPGAKAQDGPIFRHSADFFKFDGSEFVTPTTAVAGPNDQTPGTPDGALFYRKRVLVPQSSNTLYVSIYATGDTHFGAAEWFSCRVNGSFCRPGVDTGIDEAPSGWISLLKLPQDVQNPVGPPFPVNNCDNGFGGSADCHDNAVTYQWCVPVRGGASVLVDLKMATSKPDSPVFIEKGFVYIDSSRIEQPDRCVEAPLASGAISPLTATLRAAESAGEEIAGSTKPGQQQ
jgi:hypothetical protein